MTPPAEKPRPECKIDQPKCALRGTTYYTENNIKTIASQYRYKSSENEWDKLQVGYDNSKKKARDVHKVFTDKTTQEEFYTYVEPFLLNATDGKTEEYVRGSDPTVIPYALGGELHPFVLHGGGHNN